MQMVAILCLCSQRCHTVVGYNAICVMQRTRSPFISQKSKTAIWTSFKFMKNDCGEDYQSLSGPM